jgi:hypothetical protein
MDLRTSGELAEIVARLEPGLPPTYFRRQIRHLVTLGLVRPPRPKGPGRTAPFKLGEAQACETAILSTLIRMGLRAETLRWVARYLDYLGVRRPGEDKFFGSLREVIRDTKAGKRWFLVVQIKDWSESESWEHPSVLGEFREHADVSSDAGEYRSVIVLDCLRLLKPLLDELGKLPLEAGDEHLDHEPDGNGGSEAATPHRSRRRRTREGTPQEATPTGDPDLVSQAHP